MARVFQELDAAVTRLGMLSLRRRQEPTRGHDIYEVKLDEDYLMSSQFTVAEIELARLGLAACPSDRDLDVVVGGLGLGYTAIAVLQEPRVRALLVVEALDEVIDWHRRELLPDAVGLGRDERSRFVSGDFFALAASDDGFDPQLPGRRFDAVLLDVDHAPDHVLDPSHAPFYSPSGLRRLRRHLVPGGVFGLWSDDPPDDGFVADLRAVFGRAAAHVVPFPNTYTGGTSSNTVYVAHVDDDDRQEPLDGSAAQ